jgi:predicted RNA binding protein YcfA (HicA-like mRNA interferase family)
VVRRVTGSHYRLGIPGDPSRWVVVAYHNRDLHPKTLRSIIRQAGLSIDEFIDLL